MEDHGSFGANAPSPAKNFSVGDVVRCVDVRNAATPALRLNGVYEVVRTAEFVGDSRLRPGRAMRCCVWLAGIWSKGGVRLGEGSFDSERFRLISRPDPDVARERTDLSEPAQPKTHAGERARKRVGANQGNPA